MESDSDDRSFTDQINLAVDLRVHKLVVEAASGDQPASGITIPDQSEGTARSAKESRAPNTNLLRTEVTIQSLGKVELGIGI